MKIRVGVREETKQGLRMTARIDDCENLIKICDFVGERAVTQRTTVDHLDAAQLFVISSDAQSVTLRVTDVNNLPYPGVPVQAGDSTIISDSDGRVTVSAGVDVKIGIP